MCGVAWYTASVNSATAQSISTNKLNVDETGYVDPIQVPIDYTVTTKTSPDLTNSSGNTSYVLNGDVRPGTSGVTPVGEFYISATFHYAGASPTAAEAANVAALNGKTYKVEITGFSEGNAKVLTSNSATAVADGSLTHKYVYAKVSGTTITLSNEQDVNAGAANYNGSAAALSESNTLYYAIRANNEWGLEVTGSENGSQKKDGSEVAAGTIVKEGDDFYVCKATYISTAGDANASAFGAKWQIAYPHSADKISFGVGEIVEAAA